MSGSTEVLFNSNYRPSASSSFQKSNVINHFQNTMPLKKSSLANTRTVKSNESQFSYNSTQKATTSSFYNVSQKSSKDNDSRNTNRNHVQFVLPLNDSYRSNTPTNSNSNFFTNVLTPTNSSSSISNNRTSEFRNLNSTTKIDETSKSMASGLNRMSNTAPLKNLTSIRSSSFRNKPSYSSSTTTKYEPSKPLTITNPITNPPAQTLNTDFSKSRSSKSFESINLIKTTDVKSNETEKSIEANTHNIHRLIKMATNWNGKSKSKSEKDSNSSSKSKYVMSDRSLPISQTKIRKTQTFLNDENKIDSESALSRKIQEVTEKTIKVSQPSIVEAFTDVLSDKSVRIFNSSSSRTPQPIRILPMNVNRLSDMSKNNDYSASKKCVQSLLDTNEFSSKGNQYWSNSNGASEMGDNSNNQTVGSSAKESSIASYISKNSKPISFMKLNKNLNSGYKASSTQSGLNRISHGLPIHIQ